MTKILIIVIMKELVIMTMTVVKLTYTWNSMEKKKPDLIKKLVR